MPVSFNQIPQDWNLPLFWLEVDGSKAGSLVLDQPAILIGHGIAARTGAVNVPRAVGSLAQVAILAGIGSQLYQMARSHLRGNAAQELYILDVPEPPAGVAATGTLTVTGTATAAGTLPVYVGQDRVDVAVATGNTATQVATAIAAAITARTDLPVTAASAAGVVTLTTKWKGATGNEIRHGIALGGTLAGEAVPAGIAVAVAQPSGGTGTPDLSTAIANLGDEPYEYVAFGWSDANSLNAIEAEYGFGDSGRWGWMRQQYGHVFTARRDTYAGHLTFGATRNQGVTSVLAIEATTPAAPWEVTAAYEAQAARALLNDPARPLQTLELAGIVAAPKEDRFTMLERNSLAGSGLAVQDVDRAGVMRIARESTTYQTNAYGQSDDAYELVTTLATLARIFRTMRTAITGKYARHKLANNGTRFGPGQAIATPNVIRAELVAQYDELEFQGLVEDLKNFKANLVVERDTLNPNRLNVLYPPDLVNQLRIFAVLGQFRLQYDRFGGSAI